MNENPGEMPNPLNPTPGAGSEPNNNLDANPSEPIEESVTLGTVEAAPNGQVEMTSVTVGTTPVDPLSAAVDPMMRPMEKAPAAQPEPPKKSKKGLIIGLIIAAVLLIGGGVAVALVMIMNQPDPVVKAIEKIVTGNAPANVAVDGTIKLEPIDETTPVDSIEIALDSEASTTSFVNSSAATVTVNFEESQPISFEFDEVYGADGDLYFKVDGATGAIEDYAQMLQRSMLNDSNAVTNCETDINGVENCIESTPTTVEACEGEDCAAGLEATPTLGGNAVTITDTSMSGPISGILGIVEMVDGEWLRVSVDELSNAANNAPATGSDLSCLVNFTGSISSYGNTVAEAYNKNAFISSTKEGVTLASKSGLPVYKVELDGEKLEGFINAMQNSTLVQDLYSCMGYENATNNTDNIIAEIDNLPTLYVEVDNDYNFTRLYFDSEMADANMSVTTDLGFSYPVNINVAEPVEYRDFSDTIQEIFTSMYVMPGTTDTNAVN